MALSVTQPNTSIQDLSSPYSAINIRYALLTGDAAYPQTGYPVTAGTFSFSNVIIAVHPVNAAAAQYYTWYDLSNKSIHFIIPGNSTLSEVATGTNLSAVSLDVAVLGY